MSKLFKLEGWETPQELYAELDRAISYYTEEIIFYDDFIDIIKKLNNNDFGIKIDENLVKDNREDFNEGGLISYTEDDYSYESSYDDEE